MNNFSQILKSWSPLGLTITLIFLVIYLVMTQSYRHNSYDPQIQVVNDYVNNLEDGKKIDPAKITSKVNIKTSLSSFVMFFDKDQKTLASTAKIGGATPTLPKELLQDAKKKGEVRVIWEPEKGIKTATVVRYYQAKDNSGYVVTGRSLKEVENRISNLNYLITIGFIVTIILSFLAVYLVQNNSIKLNNFSFFNKKKKNSQEKIINK